MSGACCDTCAKAEERRRANQLARGRFAAIVRDTTPRGALARLRGDDSGGFDYAGQAKKLADKKSNADRGEVVGEAGGGAAGGAFGGPGGAILGTWLGGKAGKAYGSLFDGPKDCVPGEDPNDPECDGTQVVTGVRVCAPGEDPSSGCVKQTASTDGSVRRGPPKTAAFPTAAAPTTATLQEAKRTRTASAAYDVEREAGITDKDRDEAAKLERENPGAGIALALAGVGVTTGVVAIGWAIMRNKRRKRTR